MLASAPGSAASMDGAGGAKLWGYVFEIDGSRITRHRVYYDQVQFMSQLGLVQ